MRMQNLSPKFMTCMTNSRIFIFLNVVVTSVTKSVTTDAILPLGKHSLAPLQRNTKTLL